MEPKHLRYFIRTAEMLHITQAAESLYISQPALSAHIHQLEEEVGAALFDRTGRKIVLTDAGQIFYDHARLALDKLQAAALEINALKNLQAGSLQIVSLLVFGQEALPSWIASYNALYPDIFIGVRTGASDWIEEEMQAGLADIALSFVPPASGDFNFQKIVSEEIVAVLSEDHPLSGLHEITLAQLVDTPLGLLNRDLAVRRIVDNAFAAKKLFPNIAIEIDDLQALIELARRGNVATLLSRYAVGNHARLKLIPIVKPEIIIDFGILWPKSAELSPAARAFLDHVFGQLSAPV